MPSNTITKKSNAEFLKWFKPVLDALKELGGSASPKEVHKKIIEDLSLPKEIINNTYRKTGNNKFNNQVDWARNELVYAGYIDKSVRGIWALTDSGKNVDMTEELAAAIFLEHNKKRNLERNKSFEKLGNSELDALYDEFNKRFPIEKLPEMTLEQYTNTNKEDSFCYWIETKTQDIGSIWGGSSYKFGIFKIAGNIKSSIGTLRDDEYAWYSKYGNTRDGVFNNIREKIVQIANFSRQENYSAIDEIDLGDAFKWKIAFLYSNKKLINWFKKDILLEFADFYGKKVAQNTPVSELQSILIKEKGNENTWDFGRTLLSVWEELKVQDNSADKDSSSSVHYWLYAPGEKASKWEEFYKKGIMALGWDEITDLREFDSRDEIKAKLKEIHGEASAEINSSLALWEFANLMKPGDIIFVKKGMFKILGRGVVDSEYYYDSSEKEYPHIRKVKWTHNEEHDHPGQAVMKTLTDITDYTEYVGKLNSLFEVEDEPTEIKSDFEPYDEDSFFNEVFISPEKYETIVNLLERKKNIILQGAPGVGKSYAAKRLAYSIIGEKNDTQVKLVQFHQSYSYEDFIVGFRPSEKENKQFEKKYGVFYEFCKKAIDDSDNKYFFIIDEINRGNMSKIFGELLLLIESDKRGSKNKIQLLYSNEDFYVPENVYIIGMMNTADRSLAMIDYALRRRFAFVEFKPAFESDGFKQKQNEISNEKYNRLINCVKELNEKIISDVSLGKGFRIGHSYFIPKNVSDVDDEWLSDVVHYELIPLLEEYWFDETDTLSEWKRRLEDSIR